MDIKLIFDVIADAIHDCPIPVEHQNMVAYAIADQFADTNIEFDREEFVNRSTREEPIYEDHDLISSYIRHAIS